VVVDSERFQGPVSTIKADDGENKRTEPKLWKRKGKKKWLGYGLFVILFSLSRVLPLTGSPANEQVERSSA